MPRITGTTTPNLRALIGARDQMAAIVKPLRRDRERAIRAVAWDMSNATLRINRKMHLSGRATGWASAADIRRLQQAAVQLYRALARSRSKRRRNLGRRFLAAFGLFFRQARAVSNARRLAGSRIRSRRSRFQRRRGFALRGFGDAEEVITETVEETAGPATNQGLKMALAVGAMGVMGLGIWYGLTTKSYTGQRVWRGAV